MLSWDAEDRDAATLALGVGGPKVIQALNNAGYLPSCETSGRHVEEAPRVRPNKSPNLPWLLEALSHIAGVHVWHLCSDEIYMEDIITVSHKARAVELCTTCCRHPMPLASGADVEALATRLEQDLDTYHTANQATVVFLAPHRPPLPSLSASSPRAAGPGQSIAMMCGNTWHRHGFLLSEDTDGDARWSRKMQAALYAEGASTHC